MPVAACGDFIQGQGRAMSHCSGQSGPLVLQPVVARQHAGVEQQVVRDGDDFPVFGMLQESAFGPLVERPHRRPAPDLVSQNARGVSLVGPVGRLAEIGPEHQGHFMTRVTIGPLVLARVALGKKSPGLLPLLFEAAAKIVLFQERFFLGGDLVESFVSLIEMINSFII